MEELLQGIANSIETFAQEIRERVNEYSCCMEYDLKETEDDYTTCRLMRVFWMHLAEKFKEIQKLCVSENIDIQLKTNNRCRNTINCMNQCFKNNDEEEFDPMESPEASE